MKINAKLFFLAFSVIALISITSAFIYNILAQKLLRTQQSKALVNSTNDFIIAFQDLNEELDLEFSSKQKNNKNIKSTNIDFIFEAVANDNINKENLELKDKSNIYTNVKNLSEFLYYNKNILIRQVVINKKRIYYGKLIDEKILNKLSQKIRADVGVIEGTLLTSFSNDKNNQEHLPSLSRLVRELEPKSNFEIVSEELDEVDFAGTHFSFTIPLDVNYKNDFIIFTLSAEAQEFQSTMAIVTIIIVITSIILTSIILLLFSTKYRKQIEYINNVVKSISKGNLSKRVNVISKDEIGNLGNTFNNMLDEIEKRDKSEKEYSEFLAMTNKNSSLEEITKSALEKFVSSIGADVGALYLYHSERLLKNVHSIGISEEINSIKKESGLYKKARQEGKLLEIHFEENNPVIETGIAKIKINYLYILPIFYSNKILGIVELASVNKPEINVKEYLDKIKYHLAIGLANGQALSELKVLVDELKTVNQAYKEQNIKVTEKNDELLKLHAELKVKSDELERQTEKAVESEKLKSQFLANMSHELRTPQNAILGLTELILNDNETTEKNRERLNVVLRNGRKLLTLIENILEYSKAEAGNLEIKYNKIFLSELVREVSSFVQPLFLEKDVKFIVNVPENKDFLIHTDVRKIEQILFNLIGNSVKFTREGFVKLNLNIERTDLQISVQDTGTGINKEDAEIIFDEFRQADGDLNRKFNGTGLGLTICKKYAELLNGNITLESEYEKGSTFHVVLPDCVIEEIEKDEIETIDKMNALIISESKNSIKLISDYLSYYDINVTTCNASQFYVNDEYLHNINVMIIDSFNNSWQLLFEIKQHPSYNNIAVIPINLDEKSNFGLGINVYDYYTSNITAHYIKNIISKVEAEYSIKFRRLIFITDNDKYQKINSELDEFNTLNFEQVADLKNLETDLIFVDLLNNQVKPVDILVKLQEELFTKDIPRICLLGNEMSNLNDLTLNNKMRAATLNYQHHPLDVLKVIKDRIELIDSSIFDSDKKIISEQNTESSEINNQKVSSNILIVDDNDDARFTIGEIVKSLNYNPIYAKDGFECLAKIDEANPDLILLDIMMPKMDGFQTIKRIRTEERHKNITVYALTAYAMLSDQGIIEKNGFDGLFTKPINTVKLQRKLNEIFSEVI